MYTTTRCNHADQTECHSIRSALRFGRIIVPGKASAASSGDRGRNSPLRIWFVAPGFDEKGAKTANPRVARVVLNDIAVQDNVELAGPTVAHMNIEPAAPNPIMLQGDHGPVVFRNIYLREFEPAPLKK